jgi:pSer/pThr/pTyr-binding forkhead associated (FHA) protein
MSESIWLIMRGVSPEVCSWRIKARKQIIGRSHECDIQIHDAQVSRQHAKIWERSGVVFVRDLNSSNGTFVNGEQITRCALLTGKVLRIGDVSFEVVCCQTPPRAKTLGLPNSTTEHVLPTVALAAHLRSLSDAQRKVLRLLLQGASEKEAAAELGLSYHTVHTHVKEIHRELGVRSRGELMALCLSEAGASLLNGDKRPG